MIPESASALYGLSPLDGRYRGKLDSLRVYFSEFGLMRHRLEIEVRWLIWLADLPGADELKPFSDDARQYLLSLCADFSSVEAARVKRIEDDTRHDVKAVEIYLSERMCATGAPAELAAAVPFVHIACTSEDINNLAYALMVSRATTNVMLPVAEKLIGVLRLAAADHAASVMPARTHGQMASPTTWGKEMAVFAQRLTDSAHHWSCTPVAGKFNGASGNYNAHSFAWPDLNWPQICREFVNSLGLEFNDCTTQIEPGDWLVRWLNELTLFNSVALDFCRDIWAYIAIDYLMAKAPKDGEVGSSTMPHKINPIDFENAEGNLTICTGLCQTLAREMPVSRWQRDLSGSTRLRNLGVVAGHSLLSWTSILEGLSRIDVNVEKMAAELDDRHELLAEALQTEMRKLGVADAYDQIKKHTRGRRMDRSAWEDLLAQVSLSADSREKLRRLRPSDYTGQSAQLATALSSEVAERGSKTAESTRRAPVGSAEKR